MSFSATWVYLRGNLRVRSQAPQAQYVVYATACVYKELYGKIADREKKMCK